MATKDFLDTVKNTLSVPAKKLSGHKNANSIRTKLSALAKKPFMQHPIDETSSHLVLEATPPVSIQNTATTTSTQPKIKVATVHGDDTDTHTTDSDILEIYENTSRTRTTKLPFKAQLFLSVRPGEPPPFWNCL
jgi:hypothetical protein